MTSTLHPRRWLTYTILAGGLLTVLATKGTQRRGPATASASPVTHASARAVPPIPSAVPAPQVAAPQVAAPHGPPRVDVVFALDTTGSMADLIEGAKRKIWSIANFIARGQPAPELRVGLVAYRDIGDDYVTRVYDLDANLDRVYRRLLQLRAGGGGDGPEHVARALDEAVHKMSWGAGGQGGGADIVRMIYVVGDAPPHTDYKDGYDYVRAARAAAQQGIKIHAIRCGNDPETAQHWRRMASLGRGEFLTIAEDGGMRETRTPFDEELARLHDQLSTTVIAYGDGAREAEASLRAAAAAPASVKAARAGFMGARGEAVGGGAGADLVAGVGSGVVDLDRMKRDDLPKDLQDLPAPERKAKVAEKAAEQKQVLSEIQTLSGKRAAFLKKNASAKGDGFDARVEDTVRASAAAAGIKY
jgi:hypothetical protein